MFSQTSRDICGRRFKSNEQVEWEPEGYFGEFDKSYYLEGIEKLTDCWTFVVST